jgi:predicted ATPase
MIQRLYVHDFRCLENFELILKYLPSALLIGKNGSGKSAIASVLGILQNIGRGVNKVGQLVQLKEFTRGRYDVPIRLEIEVLLENKLYKYITSLELPEKFKEIRVCEEQLIVSGELIYTNSLKSDYKSLIPPNPPF